MLKNDFLLSTFAPIKLVGSNIYIDVKFKRRLCEYLQTDTHTTRYTHCFAILVGFSAIQAPHRKSCESKLFHHDPNYN